MKHSRLGIASCVTFILGVVALGTAGIVLKVMGDVGRAPHSPGTAEGAMFLGLIVLCLAGLALLLSISGLCLGLAGLANRERIRVTAAVGTVLHIVLLLGMAGIVMTFLL